MDVLVRLNGVEKKMKGSQRATYLDRNPSWFQVRVVVLRHQIKTRRLKYFLAVVSLVELVSGVELGNGQVEGSEVEILPMESPGDSQSVLHAVGISKPSHKLFTGKIFASAKYAVKKLEEMVVMLR
jgi:hypothetical protein